MSDIYYCSNNKTKKSSSSEAKTAASDKTVKSVNNNNCRENNNICGKHAVSGKTNGNMKGIQNNPNGHHMSGVALGTSPQKTFHNTRCTRHHKSHNHHSNGDSHRHHTNGSGHRRKTESVLSTDSDIRFTRRKLGDSQKCGCAVIAGFLVALLVAGVFVYIGYTYFKPEPLPDRTFRGKFRVTNEKWSMDLADQNSLRFQHMARDFRERINLIIRRSDLRELYQGSEILALDGTEGHSDIVVHFNTIFDPYAGLVSTADLLAIFSEEINAQHRKYLTNLVVDPESLTIKEVTGLVEEPVMSSSPLGGEDETTEIITTTPKPARRCEPLKLNYCRVVGYNATTYPNLLGHGSIEEVEADVISFRELVDAECFREAFDFVCRLLQPPCETHGPFEPSPGLMCREYCQAFIKGCGQRLPQRFSKFFDCETFPESTGMLSCHQKPGCANDLQSNAQSPRLCDGFADCPDLSDEKSCSFCAGNTLYCGRGRACVPRKSRCDGKVDCPDGSDEKDCLSISPLAADLLSPDALVTYLPRFHAEGFAVFSEKGVVGKLCAEGLEGEAKTIVRQTVAESLCKSLGYESVVTFEVRNDTEEINDYVRVLDPHAPEISFIRTPCTRKQVLYVGCGELQCGVQSVLSSKQYLSLPKMSSPGDWPWLVALYREDIHVCDGTLISPDWVLTTESCFQGQPRATWIAIFGSVRLASNAPWKQRRRIVGMIKSPVEGSTAALIRLETPVVMSDHVRPICLPDEINRRHEQAIQRRAFVPQAERLQDKQQTILTGRLPVNRHLTQETQQFFMSPTLERNRRHQTVLVDQLDSYQMAASHMPRAEALQLQSNLDAYPLPESAPQVDYYSTQQTRSLADAAAGQPQLAEHLRKTATTSRTTTTTRSPLPAVEQVWTNCNTLGWSRQRDHLQRVQLKIGDMAPCENISIATVNSMCTEATYQKHDCTGEDAVKLESAVTSPSTSTLSAGSSFLNAIENIDDDQEEYSGAPVQCLIPNTNQWALIGVSSWRIACGPTGVERPRMYDKITSNSAWIRETVNAA